jgi:hypothetical protein
MASCYSWSHEAPSLKYQVQEENKVSSIDIRKLSYLPAAALMLSGSSLVAAPSASVAGTAIVQSETAQSSAAASQLLQEIRSITNQLRRDAARLESYKLSGLNWQTHADQLNRARQHINDIGDRLERLQAIRNSCEPWQQQAIDVMVPVAIQLASRTEDAIDLLNGRRYLFAPAYTDHLNSIAEHANRLKQSVSVFLDAASTRDKLERLDQRVAEIMS